MGFKRFSMGVVVPLGVLNFVLCTVSAIGIVASAGSSGERLAWAGALIATGAFAAYIVMIIFWPATTRTSPRMPGVQIPSILGLCLACIGAYVEYDKTSRAAVMPLVTAVAGYVIVFWYTWLIGNYNRKEGAALRIGSRFPEIPLEKLNGEMVTSAEFVGAKTLIVFFRGNFCPLCVAQLKEVRRRAGRLSDASVRVKFISNQPVSKSRALANQLDLPSHFELLYDRDLRAATALSIVDVGGTPAAMTDFPRDTVMATAVCLDEKSRIIYAHEPQNFRRRPHPDTLLAVFDGQKVLVADEQDSPSCELDTDEAIAKSPRARPSPEVCENC